MNKIWTRYKQNMKNKDMKKIPMPRLSKVGRVNSQLIPNFTYAEAVQSGFTDWFCQHSGPLLRKQAKKTRTKETNKHHVTQREQIL